MSLALLAVLVVVVLSLGYAWYGRLIARQYALDDSRPTPAVTKNDGVDFVPTRRFFLLGQHFSAIAAAGPIAGPILACQLFGWGPSHPLDRARRGLHRRRPRLLGAGGERAAPGALHRRDREGEPGPARLAGHHGLHLDRARLPHHRLRRHHRRHLRGQDRGAGRRRRLQQGRRGRLRLLRLPPAGGRDGARPAALEPAALAGDGRLRPRHAAGGVARHPALHPAPAPRDELERAHPRVLLRGRPAARCGCSCSPAATWAASCSTWPWRWASSASSSAASR